MSEAECSVVIPVLNGEQTIEDQILAVLDQATRASVKLDLVVIDNGSTDGTTTVVSRLAGCHEPVRLLDGSGLPKGGAAAKNFGVEAAQFDKVLFCDADDLVQNGWLEASVHALGDYPVVTVSREYDTLNPRRKNYTPRAAVSETRLLGAPAISGGAFGIRRSLYLQLGGFDSQLKGAVDTEFAIRLRDAGYRPFHVSSAVVSVRLPDSVRGTFRRRRVLTASTYEIRERHSIDSDRSLLRLFKQVVRLCMRIPILRTHGGRLMWFELAGSIAGEVDGRRRFSKSPLR